MQHERIWPASKPAASENVGDVLASIRRLIAQDQTRLPAGTGPAPASLAPHPLAPAALAAPRPPLARVAPAQPAPHSPFVLGRQDRIADTPAPEQPAQIHGTATAAASTAAPMGIDTSSRWRTEPLADWPQAGAPQALPLQGGSAWPSAPLADEIIPGPEFSAEDEAEFAEAEAALARMIAPRSAEPEPLAALDPAALASPAQDHDQDLPHHTTSIEDTPMAQDMRMMEMGRMDSYAAVPPNPAPAGGYDALRGSTDTAPNLFGEIGAVAKDATMRMLIRDAIQQELHGELGARLSRNMCQMIRQEVEAVIREICAEQ